MNVKFSSTLYLNRCSCRCHYHPLQEQKVFVVKLMSPNNHYVYGFALFGTYNVMFKKLITSLLLAVTLNIKNIN